MPRVWTNGRQPSTRHWVSGVRRIARLFMARRWRTAGGISWRGSRTPDINSGLQRFGYEGGAKLAPSFLLVLMNRLASAQFARAAPLGLALLVDVLILRARRTSWLGAPRWWLSLRFWRPSRPGGSKSASRNTPLRAMSSR